MLHPGEEKERFQNVKLEFMSEESDPDGNDAIPVHPPVWHSTSKCVLWHAEIN